MLSFRLWQVHSAPKRRYPRRSAYRRALESVSIIAPNLTSINGLPAAGGADGDGYDFAVGGFWHHVAGAFEDGAWLD